MLPRFLRLPFKEAQLVLKSKTKYRSKNLELVYDFIPTITNQRWLIISSKRVIPLSTQRNRSKRVVAEAIRLLAKNIRRPIQAVIKIKSWPPKTQTPEIAKEITWLLSQGHYL